MSETEVDITCPHCRREYHLSLNLDKLTRVRTRAVCSRCRKSFDIGSRVPALAGKTKPGDVVEIYAPAEAEPERSLPGKVPEPAPEARAEPEPEPVAAAVSAPDLDQARPATPHERPETTIPTNDQWLAAESSGLTGLVAQTTTSSIALEQLLADTITGE